MINKNTINKTLKTLDELKVDYLLVGGAAFSYHLDTEAKDIDIFLMNEGNLNKIDSIIKCDYPVTEKPEPRFRHLIINDIPVQCIRSGDFESHIEDNILNSHYNKRIMSLNDVLKTSKDNKILLKRFKDIIKEYNLSEDWIIESNLPRTFNDLKIWNIYATAYDSVHNKPLNEIKRWKYKFKS